MKTVCEVGDFTMFVTILFIKLYFRCHSKLSDHQYNSP